MAWHSFRYVKDVKIIFILIIFWIRLVIAQDGGSFTELAEQLKKNQFQADVSVFKRRCERPQSMIYQSPQAFEALPVTMLSDFESLNKKGQTASLPAVLRLSLSSGKFEFRPVYLLQRGISRKDSCEAPPLKIKFLKSEIADSIQTHLAASALADDSVEYLQKYYEELLKYKNISAQDFQELSNSSLSHLGSDIKLVTHCGKSNWDQVGGSTVEEQHQRVLSELTLYKILDLLQTPSESTRLVAIHYLNPSGQSFFSEQELSKWGAGVRLGFFREPMASIAERCHLSRTFTPRPGYDKAFPDQASMFQAEFLNRLLINNDYDFVNHNVNIFYDKNGYSIFGIYDFDLSGVIQESYFKNKLTLEENFEEFRQFILKSDETYAHNMIQLLLSKKNEIQQMIDLSPVSSLKKNRMQQWFDLYLGQLQSVKK